MWWLSEFHLIVSALFPIYIASHASLSRPSSAAKPTKRKDGASAAEEEEEAYQRMEGLAPSDALLFPLFAGVTLAGLYFLIKWLEDPAILNKILGWYFGFMGIFGVTKLVGDILHVMHSFMFPKWYRDSGVVWQINAEKREATPLTQPSTATEAMLSIIRHSPLPGLFGRPHLPRSVNGALWVLRELPERKLIFKFYIHRVAASRFHLSVFGAVGIIVGMVAAIYSNFVGKPWWLTNLFGFSFCYTALQLMSPTTFTTGSLILAGLFCYDIYMVFYTPMMVTVAKALDIPIKLEFPRPVPPGTDPAKVGNAMLGLGDIVLPGLMVGLALRFDLHLHYLRKQRVIPATSENPAATVQKAPYIPPSRHWANHFWTNPLFGRAITSSDDVETGAFHKTYFQASLVGYVLGMLATLAGLEYSKRAQPALLYLVPGVLGALWLTAAAKGELTQMYHFSENIEEEESKDKSLKDETEHKARPERQPSFFSFHSMKKNEDKLSKAISNHVNEGESDFEQDRGSADSSKSSQKRRESIAKVENLEHQFRRVKGRDLVFFSISSNILLRPGSTAKEDGGTLCKHAYNEKKADKENLPTWTSSSSGSWIAVDDDEFPTKRRRCS